MRIETCLNKIERYLTGEESKLLDCIRIINDPIQGLLTAIDGKKLCIDLAGIAVEKHLTVKYKERYMIISEDDDKKHLELNIDNNGEEYGYTFTLFIDYTHSNIY